MLGNSGSAKISNIEIVVLKPSLEWNKSYSAAGWTFDIVDKIGNIYVSAGSNSVSPGSALLMKYNDSGNIIWERNWTHNNYAQVTSAIAMDTFGNIYLGVDAYPDNPFILSYNSTGDLNWSIQLHDGYPSRIVFSNNSLFIGGFSLVSDDAFIAKYSLSGNQIWNKTWDSGQYDALNGIAVAPLADRIYCTGITGPKFGGKNVLTLAYDLNGSFLWNRSWGSNADSGIGIVVDCDSYAYVCGWTTNNDHDILLLKYDTMGNLLWNRLWGTPSSDDGNNIALRNNCIFIAGNSDLGSVLLKYDTSGNFIWNTTWHPFAIQGASGIAVNDNGEIFVVGSYKINGTDLKSKVYILKYIEIPNGTPELSVISIPIMIAIAFFVVILRKNKRRDS